jgi:hypothetical protein
LLSSEPSDHLVHVAILAGNEAQQMERELLMLVHEPISSSMGIDSGKLRMIKSSLELITRLVGVLKLFSA